MNVQCYNFFSKWRFVDKNSCDLEDSIFNCKKNSYNSTSFKTPLLLFIYSKSNRWQRRTCTALSIEQIMHLNLTVSSGTVQQITQLNPTVSSVSVLQITHLNHLRSVYCRLRTENLVDGECKLIFLDQEQMKCFPWKLEKTRLQLFYIL